MLRRRDERTARAVPADRAEKPAKPRAQAAARPSRRSELERVEAEIAVREAEVATLEQRLAEDWSDVDALSAHKRSRDALQALLARWEELFDQAQA
jgi:quinol monooxygenase YgiN